MHMNESKRPNWHTVDKGIDIKVKSSFVSDNYKLHNSLHLNDFYSVLQIIRINLRVSKWYRKGSTLSVDTKLTVRA